MRLRTFRAIDLIMNNCLFYFSVCLIRSVRHAGPGIPVSVFLSTKGIKTKSSYCNNRLTTLYIVLRRSINGYARPSITLTILVILNESVRASLSTLFPIVQVRFGLLSVRIISVRFRSESMRNECRRTTVLRRRSTKGRTRDNERRLFFNRLSALY